MGFVRRLLWLVVFTAASLPSYADNAPKTPAAALPDPELLEFLVDWQDAAGQWVDPQTFAQIDPVAVAAHDARAHSKPPTATTRAHPADSGKRATR
ncbi:MAG TPA: hypothetical protein VLG68_10795 [Gammaproteobacteria bacterium]|nr:hypothetical protein [Gammaproteobacteria bacterium]